MFRLSSFTEKGVSGIRQKKWHHHWILHIQINLRTKFQLKLIISIYWTKFAQKGCFQPKTENMNTTIEFCIFELL